MYRDEMLYLVGILLVIMRETKPGKRIGSGLLGCGLVVQTRLCRASDPGSNLGGHIALDYQLDEFDGFHMQHLIQ